jgi:hypothetical protein
VEASAGGLVGYVSEISFSQFLDPVRVYDAFISPGLSLFLPSRTVQRSSLEKGLFILEEDIRLRSTGVGVYFR